MAGANLSFKIINNNYNYHSCKNWAVEDIGNQIVREQKLGFEEFVEVFIIIIKL